MTIIEREIEKRKELVAEKTSMIEELARLKDAVAALENKIVTIDEVTLNAEIAELESYLPVEMTEEVEVAIEEQPAEQIVEQDVEGE